MNDPEIIQALVSAYEKKPSRFTPWEEGFIDTVRDKKFLSERQKETAQEILSEKSSSTSDKAAARTDQWDAASGCVRCTDGMVIMQKPFSATNRSSLFPDDNTVEESSQFIECVFPCMCERGVLKKEWQHYRLDALQASDDGWRTKEKVGA